MIFFLIIVTMFTDCICLKIFNPQFLVSSLHLYLSTLPLKSRNLVPFPVFMPLTVHPYCSSVSCGLGLVRKESVERELSWFFTLLFQVVLWSTVLPQTFLPPRSISWGPNICINLVIKCKVFLSDFTALRQVSPIFQNRKIKFAFLFLLFYLITYGLKLVSTIFYQFFLFFTKW